MRRRSRTGRLLSIGMAVAVALGATASPMAVLAQETTTDPALAGCAAEAEPNDLPEQAPSLIGEVCQSGTLPERGPPDQDLLLWEVLPEDGLTEWSVTVRGVPTTITSIRFIPIISAPGVLPPEVTGETLRVDSDAHLGTPPGTATSRIAPGRYLLGISRGAAGFGQQLTDDLAYEVRVVRTGELPQPGDVEPNDDAATATPVDGAFEFTGDLAASADHYRWTVTAADAAAPLRLEARTAIGAPLTLELATASGEMVSSVTAAADGVAMLHDLGLAPGDYDIAVSPAASQAQPYALAASAVADAGVDPEPNNTPERALALDPAAMAASGRLTGDPDVDQYVFDVDATLAENLVDVDLSWSEGIDRTLCLSTDGGTRIGCRQGDGHVAMPGLMLPEGRYRLEVSGVGSLDDRYGLRVAPGTPLPPSGDVEPNDDAATASPVAGAFAISGDLTASASGAGDVYAWTLSEADAARTWRLEASATPGIAARLSLYDADGASLAVADLGPEGTAQVFDLRLLAGTYRAWVTQGGNESPRYVLRGVEETAPGVDPEPNDLAARAVPLDPVTRTARGRIATGSDVDRYSFDIDEAMAASLVDVTLAWPSQVEYQLCLNTGDGSAIQCRYGRDGVALTDLLLAPGRHEIAVSASSDPESRYDVSVTNGLAPSPDHEVEPNDLATAATAWDPALPMHGRSKDGDLDTYRIHVDLGVPEVWRLEATGTGLGTPLWTQPDGTRVGSATISDDGTASIIEDLYLVGGDHLLSIGADGEYTIALTPLGPPDLAAEREPNDDPDHAGLLQMSGLRSGRLPAAEDVDVYRFYLSAPEHVVVTVEPPDHGSVGLEITSAGSSLAQVAATAAGQPTVFDGSLPQGDHELWLRPATPGENGYTVGLSRADPFTSGAMAGAAQLPAELALTTAVTEVAAFWREGQRVDGTLTVRNDGPADLALALDSAVSHGAWSVELSSTDVAVPAGDTADVPLVIHVPADAWLDIPVRVTVRARHADGAQGTDFAEITPGRDVPPVSVEQVWTVPPELLGGLDVASAALGAQPVGSHFHEMDIHDGLSIAGLGLSDNIQNGPLTIGVDLAGDEPVTVSGTILDPLAGDSPFAFRPRAFALLLSEDGVTYEQVLSAELGPQTEHQAFILETPVPARFAQLRIDTTWGEATAQVYLGEWKVVAAPGFAPTTAGLNIADAGRGGHVVWSDPGSSYVYFDLLREADTQLQTRPLEAGQPAVWVVGFAEDRAAQVSRLEWADQVGSDPAYRFTSADVAVSLDSPLGPWRELGTWALERAPDGSVASFTPAEPTWARFIRLTAQGRPEESSYAELPSAVRVIEQPTDDTYRSILGEWGQSSPRGIYELLVPPASGASASDVPDVGDAPGEAAPLDPGEAAHGQVARGKDVDWYTLTMPDGQNTLRLDLRTGRERDVRVRLQDAAGGDVAFDLGRTEDPAVTSVTAIVEPGATYYLEVIQPVLSVVVIFDTSASLFPWFPKLRAAVRAFADDVTPGQEGVQIRALGEGALLEGWSDQAYLIGGAMDAWATGGGSSALEDGLTTAAGMLAERDGTRAILVLGDAVGGGFEVNGGIPAATLEQVRPAIFPVHLGGMDDPFVSTHIMWDLAATNGGFYQYATSQAAIERAFDRMATWLRRPAAYGLSYATSFVGYPPGTLSVVPAEGASVPVGGGVSVELVLDTSGSMNKRLAGVTRMAVAREVLVRLVDETLPEGLPVALRTFKAGNGSCKTVLAVPFGPLERAAMDRVIAELPLHRKTRTPLGATLRAVGDDLAGRPGPKVVVFVTDGKETCKGDPAAEVERLVELGVEVALNIVGFALEDPALKADMESWAASGGGVFFDAQDQESLLGGIVEALRAPFRVYGRDGALVASGVVGGAPVGLPAGSYRVEVLTEPPAAFEAVEVAPGEAVRLEVGPGAP